MPQRGKSVPPWRGGRRLAIGQQARPAAGVQLSGGPDDRPHILDRDGVPGMRLGAVLPQQRKRRPALAPIPRRNLGIPAHSGEPFGDAPLHVIRRPGEVSRWSARSEARTYDLDAVEDGRMMAAAGGDWDGLAGSGLLWVIGVGAARRDALPYLGARTASAVRRRDDRWGDPRCCAAVARSFRAGQRWLTTGTLRERTAGHQLHFGHGARCEHGQSALAQAASPRARRV
jgi:hypothetical protein